MSKQNKRLAYFKRGNVVDELQRIGPEPETVPDGGADHYIANFLNWSAGNPVLLMSYYEDNKFMRAGKVCARMFKRSWKKHNALIRAAIGIHLFARTLLQLLFFRPTWIFCAASGPPLWACSIVSSVLSVPLVLTRHNRLELPHGSFIKRSAISLTNKLIRKSSAIIAHTAYLENQLMKIGVNKDKLFQFNLSYGYLLDQSDLPDDVPDLTGDGQYTVVLFVGRLDIHKGVYDLLEAMKERLTKDKNVRLVYAGHGSDYESVKQKASEYRVGSNVLMLGHVDNKLLKSFISQSRFVVTPTHEILPEARCKAAVESVVLGRPVIVPDLEPFRYIIQHGKNGLLFPDESVTDLRSQINRMLDDNELYETLKTNAKESGRQYLESEMTFRQALEHTYKLTMSK